MSRADMDRGSVWQSVSGFPSRVEAHLPVLLSSGVSEGRLGIERLVEVASTNPARLWGLYPRKGAILPGSDADFVIVDLSKRVTLGPAQVLSAAGWSIYEGVEFRGWPVATILRGQLGAEWTDQTCSVSSEVRGQYLRRDSTAAQPSAVSGHATSLRQAID
jgi:dihydroorotase-like cyclic amidohydrolase